MFAGPRVLKPFIQKMIDTGNLSAPKGEWSVEWEEADKLGEAEQATVALTKMNAIKSYMTTPAVETIIAPEEARILIGMDPTSDYELAEPDDVGDGEGEIDPLTGLPKLPENTPPGAPVDDKNAPPVDDKNAPPAKEGAKP
jgi:hypothetical protein